MTSVWDSTNSPLVYFIGILRTANPSATLTRGPPPLSGAVKLGSPVGWCSAQRIRILMIASGNHTLIQLLAARKG